MEFRKKEKKHILVFSQHFWPEEFRVNDVCRGLVEQGYDVDVICGIPNYPDGKVYKSWGFFKRTKENWNGINIRRVWEIPRGKKNSMFRILLNFVSWPFFCMFYLPFIGKKYDRVLMYQLSPVIMSFPAIVYRAFTKIPLTIYILDYWPFSVFAVMNIKSNFVKHMITKLSRWHYRKADGIIAVFEGMLSMLINDVKIDSSKIIYIPQACEKLHEEKLFDESIQEKYKNKFCIVFTGSINPAQSFDIVIQAAKICFNEGLTNIHWVIVGDGMSRNDVEEMVEKNGLKNNFHFEGYHPVTDMPKYYAIADAFIVALKKSELGSFGIPAKIQSYFAAGKPIIGAMDGDAAMMINDNHVGLCGPSDSIETLSKNIRDIYMLTEDERIAMGERAKKYYYEHFERNEQLKKLINFMFREEG
ncbi:MAG: glycosyltransferase family 4 protein [Oscillospiraceae bacterium]|jgi:glycosyltransferase involved in cell wall biosynthesis|nr:glycosyltransferase family 4 protein [Oscillospiraceae bacterium]